MLTKNQCNYLGIYDKQDIKKISKKFKDYDSLKNAIARDGYSIYIDIVGWEFTRTDNLIAKKYNNQLNSPSRCRHAMEYVIKSYSNKTGSTKMQANEMFNMLYKIIGNCSKYCMDVIRHDVDLFHYEESSKMIGLKSLYDCEKNIAYNIKSRLANNEAHNWNIEKYRHMNEMEFTDEQIAILRLASDNKITILCGPAGTGKSQTTKILIDMLEEHGQKYRLLAPTGIAAKRLREATERDAFTIHMFLLDDCDKLDYCIVDEFSMIGVELLSKLFNHPAITKETRFVFICDEAQLASISPGNIIKNLLDSGKIPTAKLTKVFRYGSNGIATWATDIRNEQEPNMKHNWNDAIFNEYSDKVQTDVIKCLNEAMDENGYDINDILLLTPKKISPLGTYTINRIIQDWTNNGAHLEQFDYIIKDRGQEYPIEFHIGDKVINKKNNYNALTSNGEYSIIMNGEIGIVTGVKSLDNPDTGDKEECLCVQFDNDEIAYNKKEIRNLQLAYALTVHSCQGQQAKCVIFLAHEDSTFMLTRNLMYVAVSRAQEMLYIISDEDVITDGLTRASTDTRVTWLENLLNK